MKVGVIGAGAWGCALAVSAARGGHDVVLWSYDGRTADFITGDIKISQNMYDLQNSDIWLVATPSEFFRETVSVAREFYNKIPVIICTKGIEQGNLMSEILSDVLPECTDVGVLGGPQFAAEVARGIPTGSSLAGTPTAIRAGRAVLSEFYIQETDDIIGVQICGAGKNAVAVIMGHASVMATGENERAMILTRAWAEVVKIGLASGAKIETFLGLCGIGDLFLTATSITSRNFSAGVAIARNEPIFGTVEGVSALHGLSAMARKSGIDTPILSKIII
jgi:glycerol-3-phosphate dehydrogenase (NAD(P)+)